MPICRKSIDKILFNPLSQIMRKNGKHLLVQDSLISRTGIFCVSYTNEHIVDSGLVENKQLEDFCSGNDAIFSDIHRLNNNSFNEKSNNQTTDNL